VGAFKRFCEYYDLIYRGIVDYEKECSVLEKIFVAFSSETIERILDIGCGTGSHALILSKRGYKVTGVDVSCVMIEKAKRKADEEQIEADFFVQDMRNLKLNRNFDCAICMFGGFGYILSPEGLASLFSGLNHHLRKDGLFIFEFWNIGGLKPSPYKSWMKIQNKNVTLYRLSESNFNPKTKILNLDMHFVVTHKNKLVETFTEIHKIRCYTPREIQQYLDNNRFELLSAYNWDAKEKAELKRPGKETFRILVVSRKED
jgi:SAM-dependent methyltransferase